MNSPEKQYGLLGVVVAAGGGIRFGGPEPKQFLDLCGSTVLARSIRCLADHPDVEGVVVVLSRSEIGSANETAIREIDGVVNVVEGGATRAESCLNGLRAAAGAACVLVHDAARPAASPELVDRVVQATLRHGAAIPVLPLRDTIKEVSPEGTVLQTPDRERLSAAQTPQGARTDWLIEALERSMSGSVTDEASALEAAGRTVYVVEGDPGNLKITTLEDLETLRRKLGEGEGMRIGSGYDVHRFGGEQPLVLAGVPFPGETGLVGHSDADVVLHAVMDALLGAAGMGDIGQHFPPTDPAYKGADSRLLTRTVLDMVSRAGFRIGNVDITVLAERPRIGPRLEEMKTALSGLLELKPSEIGLKATTLEGMGALGRSEGIGCQAVALLLRRGTALNRRPLRVRFAPSPTGSLHLGNARTALINWIVARQSGGTLVIRVEDTDTDRHQEGAESGILEDLRWLGLAWDEGPDIGGDYGPYRQSERHRIYQAAADRLLDGGRAYRCFCSPEEQEEERDRLKAAGEVPRYLGRCGRLDAAEAGKRADAGEPFALRFRTLLPGDDPETAEVRFHDRLRGSVTFLARELGDPVMVRRDGRATYNFAVVVDDAAMKIDLVLRGDDHLSNTPRQVLYYGPWGGSAGFCPPPHGPWHRRRTAQQAPWCDLGHRVPPQRVSGAWPVERTHPPGLGSPGGGQQYPHTE